MSKLCPYCKSKKVGSFNDTVMCCMACHRVFGKSQLIDSTLFDRITESPEVLARSLCGNVRVGCFSGYYSMLTGRHYPDMEAAIAATVARLKEVCVEQDAVDYTQARLSKVDDTQKRGAE